MKQQFTLPATSREAAVARVSQFMGAALPGKELTVTVELRKKRRSDEQNRFWWGVVVKAFTDALPGWSPEDVHTYLCGEHFGWERIEGLGKVRLRPIQRSSKLSKAEFADLVAKAQQIGAEHGIYVSDPNE